MKILVATDFSPEAIDATHVAADLAKVLGASLHIVHVAEPSSIYPLNEPAITSEIEASVAHARTLISSMAVEIGASNVTTQVRVGEPIREIAAEVSAQQPALVVVGACGAHGKGSIRGRAETLALTLASPVLAVRPVSDRLRFALTTGRAPRLFVAVDRTAASDRALAYVRSLRQQLDCDIVVAHYYDPTTEHRRFGLDSDGPLYPGDAEVTARLTNEMQQRCSGMPGRGALSVRCEPRVGLTAIEIIAGARVCGADLIVVGVHRRSTLSRQLWGSVARDLVRHSDIPVLCVAGPRLPTDRTDAEIPTIDEADDPSTIVM